MRKRNVPILFRLTKKEAELLDKRVKRCGLTREAYLRHLVAGFAPKEAPPPDYYSMMRELYGIGRNLNQIAQKAHALGVIDAQRYDTEARRPNGSRMQSSCRDRWMCNGNDLPLARTWLAGQGGDLCGKSGQDRKPVFL